MRIPFDSLCVAAVVAEIKPWLNSQLQRIHQPTENEITLTFWSDELGEMCLLLSGDASFARMHLTTRRRRTEGNPSGFLTTLRSRLGNTQLIQVKQKNFDRLIFLDFSGEEGSCRLVVELMGKHSNLILVDEKEKILGSLKVVGASKSKRPILAGKPYLPPPFPPKQSLLEAGSDSDIREYTGASPFLVKLIESGVPLRDVQKTVAASSFAPCLVGGMGAYPVSVKSLGLSEVAKSSFSSAVEQYFDVAIIQFETDQLKRSLTSALDRVLLARDVALNDLYQARETGSRADQHQRLGELILAYGYQQIGAEQLTVFDYDGTEVQVKVDPELSPPQNAELYFEKAKKSRARQSYVVDQIERLEQDRLAADSLRFQISQATRLEDLLGLKDEVIKKRWLVQQALPVAKEERAYQGHRIKEVAGPHGFRILYGENATSNDYLTLRVARSEDWWLHVKGQTSVHVVVVTNKKPDRVPFDVLLFAAKLAVQNSVAKHSGYVEVVYTLKKYVRKPKGAPVGTALYTHEKTITIKD